VYERIPGSGVYWIRYADSSGRVRKEKIGPRLSSAVTLYQKRKTEAFETRHLPELAETVDVRFSRLATDYLEYGRVHHAPKTQIVDRLRLEKVLQVFRARPIAAITPQDLVRFLGQQASTPATRNRYRALVSKCFSLAIRNGLAKENPVAKVERFRENNARVRFLDAGEEKRLRVAISRLCPERTPEVVLAMNTGMRRSEQFRLRWTDLDLARGREMLTVERSKNSEKRHIPLNDQALEAIRELRTRALAEGSEFVISATDRQREGNYPIWFRTALEQAKIKNFRWHDLRHTFASRLTMAGRDLRTVQELLGHKTMSMTVRYSHLSAPHKREAVLSLGKYAQKSPEAKA
jgi:site-specific recombinase XerD